MQVCLCFGTSWFKFPLIIIINKPATHSLSQFLKTEKQKDTVTVTMRISLLTLAETQHAHNSNCGIFLPTPI